MKMTDKQVKAQVAGDTARINQNVERLLAEVRRLRDWLSQYGHDEDCPRIRDESTNCVCDSSYDE